MEISWTSIQIDRKGKIPCEIKPFVLMALFVAVRMRKKREGAREGRRQPLRRKMPSS